MKSQVKNKVWEPKVIPIICRGMIGLKFKRAMRIL